MSVFVLIHGAGDSSFSWSLVEPRLRALGHDVVAPDLPADDPDAGLPEYVDTVLDAIGDRSDLVVVGQSLGGFTAGQIPKHREVNELIYVNAMIPRAGETGMEWWGNTNYAAEFTDDLVEMFFHLTPPALAQEAMAHSRDENGSMDDPFPGGVPAVPTRVICSEDDRCFPLDWALGVGRERTGLEPIVIPGDHCVALSRPDALVTALTA